MTVATCFGVGDQMVEVLEHRDDGSVQCSLSADTHWRIEMSRSLVLAALGHETGHRPA